MGGGGSHSASSWIFNILLTHQGLLSTNNTFKILLYQRKNKTSHQIMRKTLTNNCGHNTVCIHTVSPIYSWITAADSTQSEHTQIHLFTAGSELQTQHSLNTHRFTYLQLAQSCRLNSLNTHRFTYLQLAQSCRLNTV